MKSKFINAKVLFQALLVATLCTTAACSTSQSQEEPTEAVEAEESKKTAPEEHAGTTASSGGEEAAPVSAPEPAPEPMAGLPTTTLPVPTMAEPTPAQAAASPAPSPVASESKDRVVRYVTGKKIPIYAGPNDKASKVGNLERGERIMIVEENGWGRIADNMFVKLSALSTKAVPRNRQPTKWSKPQTAK